MLRKKSEAEQAADKVALKRLARCYALPVTVAILAAVVFIIWATGYAQGYLDGYNGRPQVMESN